jgi:hypothetical protein
VHSGHDARPSYFYSHIFLRMSCHTQHLIPCNCSSRRWVVDELAPFTLSRLSELRVVPVVAFDYRFDVWTIEAELSPGCGGPEIVEEVMV